VLELDFSRSTLHLAEPCVNMFIQMYGCFMNGGPLPGEDVSFNIKGFIHHLICQKILTFDIKIKKLSCLFEQGFCLKVEN
jgi:hypothetical protein